MWIRRETFITMSCKINQLEHKMDKVESQLSINFSEQHVYSSIEGNHEKRYHIVKADALYHNSIEAIPKWVINGIDNKDICTDETGLIWSGEGRPYIEYYINMGFSRHHIGNHKYLIEEISPEHKSGKFYVLDEIKDVFKLAS